VGVALLKAQRKTDKVMFQSVWENATKKKTKLLTTMMMMRMMMPL